MQIQTNVPSLFVQRQLEKSSEGLNTSLRRLSSGLRINSAKDDAAGLAISERMDSLIRGNTQARRNVNDGVSLLQTAEGAMQTVTDSIQRIRELAVQAANATNSLGDKQALQQEANQLLQNIDQIAGQTEFNGEKIFSQNRNSLSGTAAERAVLDGLKLGWLEESVERIQTYYGITGDNAATLEIVLTPPVGSGLTSSPGGVLAAVGSLTGTADGQGRTLNPFLYVDMADFTPPNLPDGGSAPIYNDRIIAHEMVHAVMGRSMNFNSVGALPSWFKEGAAEFIHGADERLSTDYNGGAGLATILTAFGNDDVSASAGYSAGYAAVRYMHQKIKEAGGDGIKDIMVYLNQNAGSDLSQALTNASSGAFADLAGFKADFNADAGAFIGGMNLTNSDTGAIGGYDTDQGSVLSAKDILLDRGDTIAETQVDGFALDYQSVGGVDRKSFALQVGAKSNETITASIAAMNVSALGIDSVDLVNLPQFALYDLDKALDFVSKHRAEIGGAQSRLESTAAQLETSIESQSAARSRIRDADYATETASLTRQNILRQAGTAMLSQANSMPNLVLQLLR
ncbi:flagellin [Formivibrio citricus]|uniref:Flagellin n=1 Tax=Formivibrio citricus TaxID=83765 RepID=A0A1I4ZAZ9_9NEIS|nr:flagellinolysin [Formivibrio citricus]SFN47378.1 flagellin [Formivibrio citricus]